MSSLYAKSNTIISIVKFSTVRYSVQSNDLQFWDMQIKRVCRMCFYSGDTNYIAQLIILFAQDNILRAWYIKLIPPVDNRGPQQNNLRFPLIIFGT